MCRPAHPSELCPQAHFVHSSGGLYDTVKEYHTRQVDVEAQRPIEMHVEWIHQDFDFVVHVG
jgi:hypothetical protein